MANAKHKLRNRKPASGNRPNILFLFPDQHRRDWLGVEPAIPVRTPNLDALAECGVRFTNCITPSPLCAPARASLACGKEYDRCGVPGNDVDYPYRRPTFYRMLREGGYHTMGCGKFDLAKARCDWKGKGTRLLKSWGFSDGIDNEGKWDGWLSGREKPKGPYWTYLHAKGLDEVHGDDFERRREAGVSATFPTALPDEAYCDNWLASIGLDLIRSAPAGQPWFLQVNFTGPHDPWDITERMAELYKDVHFPHPIDANQLSPEQYNAVRQNYSAMVENIDRWVGLYIQELSKRGELDNTLIVFSSDHGEMLGDHDTWGKGRYYQQSVGVPLVVAGPGVHRDHVHDGAATIMDLAATFLDYGGVDVPEDMDSLSMRPLLEGRTEEHRRYAHSGLRDWRLVFEGRYKLIQRKGHDPILRDLQNDPAERNDLADAIIGRPIVEWLQDELPEF